MTQIETRTADGSVIWQDPRLTQPLDPRVFDPDWLRAQGYHDGHSAGRFQAHFLRLDGQAMVLRHYYRGGMIGRIIRDLFLRVPVRRSRAMAEFQLLGWMRQHGLPVPEPLAARFAPVGLCYRADLLMGRIEGARTLADWLHNGALSPEDWHQIGGTLGRMHALNVDHTDLNCRNILLDTQRQVWLIDFDKCRRRASGPWKQGNLARLRRSLDKEKSRQPGLMWSEAAWTSVLAGYAEARD